MELVQQLDPLVDEIIRCDRKAPITNKETNNDNLNNDRDEINDGNNVIIFLDDDTENEIVLDSIYHHSVPGSILTQTSSQEQSSGSSISSFGRKSILKSSLDTKIQSNRTTLFSTIEIREYQTTLGDNPGGTQGPPISLDWDYSSDRTQMLALEEYEETRLPRRSESELHMNDRNRRWMLLREKGFSLMDIHKATMAAESVRVQRRKSMQCQNLKKTIRRIICKWPS